jgi:hypothetical protein
MNSIICYWVELDHEPSTKARRGNLVQQRNQIKEGVLTACALNACYYCPSDITTVGVEP